MLGCRVPKTRRLELDRAMLERMKHLFDTHADADGKLRVRFSGNVLQVENAHTGQCETLGPTHLPDFLRVAVP